MTKEELLELAEEEFANIITNCTESELDNLLSGLDVLDGDDSLKCIYGLMTKTCWSERAKDLIKVSTKGVYFMSTPGSNKKAELKPENILRVRWNTENTFTPLEKALYWHKSEVVAMIKSFNL